LRYSKYKQTSSQSKCIDFVDFNNKQLTFYVSLINRAVLTILISNSRKGI